MDEKKDHEPQPVQVQQEVDEPASDNELDSNPDVEHELHLLSPGPSGSVAVDDEAIAKPVSPVLSRTDEPNIGSPLNGALVQRVTSVPNSASNSPFRLAAAPDSVLMMSPFRLHPVSGLLTPNPHTSNLLSASTTAATNTPQATTPSSAPPPPVPPFTPISGPQLTPSHSQSQLETGQDVFPWNEVAPR